MGYENLERYTFIVEPLLTLFAVCLTSSLQKESYTKFFRTPLAFARAYPFLPFPGIIILMKSF
jgi:hypothetical protein